jgi:hypothetical protein
LRRVASQPRIASPTAPDDRIERPSCIPPTQARSAPKARSRVSPGGIPAPQLLGCGVAFRATHPTSHEQLDEARYEGTLVPGQATHRFIELTNLPEPTKLARQAITADPPQALEQLDEGDAGGIGGCEKICRGGPSPRRTRRIEQSSDVSGIATHGGAQCPHREIGSLEDITDFRSEFVVVWWHFAVLRELDRARTMVAGSVGLT